ncbi:MAG: hypothetical protein B7733_17480 [Myxococcales bacterium FL481]|nr:MAG: hypothetical protein B7733_17480 [Myxococcales bacterium FL481]
MSSGPGRAVAAEADARAALESATVAEVEPDDDTAAESDPDGDAWSPATGSPGDASSDSDTVSSESEPDPDDSEPEPTTSSERSGTALSGQAREQDDGEPGQTEIVGKQKRPPQNLTHVRTAGVSAGFGLGYGLITAGDKFCGEFAGESSGDTDGRKSLCTGATAPTLDIGLSYGVLARLDVVVSFRLALSSRQFDGSGCSPDEPGCRDGSGLFVDKRAFGFMPGIRLWGSDNDKVVKIGGAADFVWLREDFSGYRERPLGVAEDPADEATFAAEEQVGDNVLGLRGGPIIQIDPHHHFGVFFMPAAVVSFRPAQDEAADAGWFETAFEASLGVQARFP